MVQYGGFHKWGTLNWMVCNGKSHLEVDDLGWGRYFRNPPHCSIMSPSSFTCAFVVVACCIFLFQKWAWQDSWRARYMWLHRLERLALSMFQNWTIWFEASHRTAQFYFDCFAICSVQFSRLRYVMVIYGQEYSMSEILRRRILHNDVESDRIRRWFCRLASSRIRVRWLWHVWCPLWCTQECLQRRNEALLPEGCFTMERFETISCGAESELSHLKCWLKLMEIFEDV